MTQNTIETLSQLFHPTYKFVIPRHVPALSILYNAMCETSPLSLDLDDYQQDLTLNLLDKALPFFMQSQPPEPDHGIVKKHRIVHSFKANNRSALGTRPASAAPRQPALRSLAMA